MVRPLYGSLGAEGLNAIINPCYHSCVSVTDIYLTISLSTHNGDDMPQNNEISFSSIKLLVRLNIEYCEI